MPKDRFTSLTLKLPDENAYSCLKTDPKYIKMVTKVRKGKEIRAKEEYNGGEGGEHILYLTWQKGATYYYTEALNLAKKHHLTILSPLDLTEGGLEKSKDYPSPVKKQKLELQMQLEEMNQVLDVNKKELEEMKAFNVKQQNEFAKKLESFNHQLTEQKATFLKQFDELKRENQEISRDLQIQKNKVQGLTDNFECLLEMSLLASPERELAALGNYLRRGRLILPEKACRILGVSVHASESEVKTAFRNRSRKIHPDKYQEITTSSPVISTATKQFQRLLDAYNVLMNLFKMIRANFFSFKVKI